VPDFNNSADFWRYEIGVNVIPANTRNKTTWVIWIDYQDSPISETQHNLWKKQGAFNDGIALIPGKIWHNTQRKEYYLVFVDLDNQKAIDEFRTSTKDGETRTLPLQELAEKMIVEQHLDDTGKAHVYFYAKHPYRKKSSDVSSRSEEIDANQVPAFEVKSLGSHGIAFCSESPHKNGSNYQIIGTRDPQVFDNLEEHIDSICRKYNINYLNGRDNGNNNNLIPISELFKPDTVILEGHNRHQELLRIMESLLRRNERILDHGKIKEFAEDWNKEHCRPPLESKEFEKQWACAQKFIAEADRKRAHERQRQKERIEQESYELETRESENRKKELKNPLSIHVLARLNEEGKTHNAAGHLTSLGNLYKLIRAVDIRCPVCLCDKKITFLHPHKYSYFQDNYMSHGSSCIAYFDSPNCEGHLHITPEYVSAVNIEVSDPASLHDLDKVKFILFGDDTKDVGIGENVTILGTVYMEPKKDGQIYPTVYAQSVKYEDREQEELTALDIHAIKRFRQRYADDDEFIKKLVSMMACNVIGHDNIKEGILYMVTNAKPDKRDKRERIHGAIISNPGRAKTALLMYATELMTRSTFETAQLATGLSLLAIVENENDTKVLRLGPVSKSLFASIDEFNKLTYVDQEKFYGVMQEGYFTVNKFGRNQKIPAPATVLASMNPPEDFRQTDEYDRINLSDMNVIRPILDRFDLKFYIPAMRDKSERRELANAKADLEGHVIPDYSKFIKKLMMYVKQNFNPKLTDEAKSICVEAFVEIGEYNPVVSPRVLDTLINLTKARARLLLKKVVGPEEAKAAIEFYGTMIHSYQTGTIAPKDPIDIAVKECVTILKASLAGGVPVPYTVKELFKKICERNDQVYKYISSGVSKTNLFDRSNNKKVRNIFESLMKRHNEIKVVSKNPTCIVWVRHQVLNDTLPQYRNSQPDRSDCSDLSRGQVSNKNVTNLTVKSTIPKKEIDWSEHENSESESGLPANSGSEESEESDATKFNNSDNQLDEEQTDF